MKIYYFSDKSFLDMKNKFEESFKDNFEKKFQYIENINVDRNKPGSGVDIWKYKTEMIVNAIKSNMSEIIVISDIDIVFYKPVIPIINKSMEGYDICFQKKQIHHGINIGFISIRCCETTLKFFEKVYDILIKSDRWDQGIVNDLIYNHNYDIKWNLFPHAIWNWSQGKLNKDISLHHANCVSEKEGKYKQMEHVRKFLESN